MQNRSKLVWLGMHAIASMVALQASSILVDRCNDSFGVTFIYESGYELSEVSHDAALELWQFWSQPLVAVSFAQASTFGNANLVHTFLEQDDALLRHGTLSENVRSDGEVDGVRMMCDGKRLWFFEDGQVLHSVKAQTAVALDHAAIWYDNGRLYGSRNFRTQMNDGGLEVEVEVAYPLPSITSLTISGNEVWGSNQSCIKGLFGGLEKCVPGWDITSSLMTAGSEHEVFVMDASTGALAGFPHSGAMDKRLRSFFARIADGGTEPVRAVHIPEVPILLGPRLAAQPMAGVGTPFSVEYSEGVLKQQFKQPWGFTTLHSPLPPITSERAHAHWAPALCEPIAEECPFFVYKNSAEASCTQTRNPCTRGSRSLDTADTECATIQPEEVLCKQGYYRSEDCPAGHVQYFYQCSGHYTNGTARCLPSARCNQEHGHTYDLRTNRCLAAPSPPTAPSYRRAARQVTEDCIIESQSPNAPPVDPSVVCGPPGIQFLDGNECKVCELCPAGTYMKSDCEKTQRVCADCPAGYYQDDAWHKERTCKALNGCPGGTKHSNGKCLNLSWFRDHWYIVLHVWVVCYTIWGVRVYGSSIRTLLISK